VTLAKNRTLAALLLVACCVGASGAFAADKVQVGKSVSQPFAFAPVEIGAAEGIWAKHDIEVETIIFAGDAKLQQGLVAGSVDFGLGSGPAMGFLAKGVPAKAVAVLANEPLSMGLIVGATGAIKTPQDLKGTKIGVTTAGSLSDWLARELSRQLGFGSNGIEPVALGAMTTMLAAMKRGQIDGVVLSSSQGYQLEKSGDGRLLLEFGTYIKDFHTHVIYATEDMITNKSDQVRRFLAGWKETIAFMAANKAETVRVARQVTGLDEAIENREYDDVMPMMSRDLRFSAKALDVIGNSFPEMNILPAKPDMRTLYTEEFLGN
jgi:NitT/TauT family transport system substrate-binding protein